MAKYKSSPGQPFSLSDLDRISSTFRNSSKIVGDYAPLPVERKGPLQTTDNGLYGGSGSTISQAPEKSWWDQHIVGGLSDLKKFLAPSEEDLLARSHIAPKPFETAQETAARVGEARQNMNGGNNDLAGSSIVRGATFGLVRPQNLSEVPLNGGENITEMIGQGLGSSALAPASEALGLTGGATKLPLIGDALKPGENALTNWVKSGIPGALSNISAGQTSISMDNSDTGQRATRALTDAGFSYLLHTFHLPADIEAAKAYDKAPTFTFSTPEEADIAIHHLVDTGNYPTTQKDLGNGELGIATQNNAGEAKLYKIKPANESASNTELAAGGTASASGTSIGESTGVTKKSRLAQRMSNYLGNLSEEEKAALPDYQVMSREATINKAASFVEKSPDDAIAIVRGEKPEVDGVPREALLVALKQKAALPENYQLAKDLANNQSLTSTEYGQRLNILSALDEENPVNVMENINRQRVEAAGGKAKVSTKVNAEVEKIRREIKTTPLTSSDWQEFTDSLPKEKSNNKLLEAIKSDEVNPQKLQSMTSEERHTLLAKYTGEEKAQKVNALFESKTLVKNQKKGMINWAKTVTGLKPDVRKDIIASIERLDKVLTPAEQKAFLRDLATQRLGFGVTSEEAKNISTMASKVQEAKVKNPDSLEYGREQVKLDKYVQQIKDGIKKPVSLASTIYNTSGLAKAVKAAFDISALLRQGFRSLLTNPGFHLKNSALTFKDLFTKFGSEAVMDEIHATVYADHNYDLMKKAKLAVSTGEEAFPTSLPAKIPIIGRVFRASESAYEGFLIRQRVDIFNKYVEIAQKSGVDINSKQELIAIGKVVNSLTGRGDLGAFEKSAGAVNSVLFSPRFVKSHIDVLTAHTLDKSVTPFARKQAATNLVKIIAGTAGILATAKAFRPDSVETDPRSSDFGKIRVGDTRFDATGGMASIATLASRLITNSTKSANTGAVSDLNSGSFGSQTSGDVITNFLTNKLSPTGSVLLDLANRQDRNGNPLTAGGEAANFIQPLPITTYQELKKDPNSADTLLSMIADGLGVSANTYDQGQSKPGIAGVRNQITAALVNGDKAQADRIINANFPYTDPDTGTTTTKAEALANAASTASSYTRRAPEKTTDFYQVYSPVRTERDKVSKQVTTLVKQGNFNQARRVADQYNNSLPDKFSSFYGRYKDNNQEFNDQVGKLKIITTIKALSARRD